MKTTQRVLSLLLVAILFLCSMPVVAFGAENPTAEGSSEEISFSKDRLLTVHESLTETPNTFHTSITLPVGATEGGVIFGNYLSDQLGFFSLEINQSGNPVYRFTNAKGEIVQACFEAVDVRLGQKVALTVVRTDTVAYCYINGNLAQRIEGKFGYGDVMTAKDVWEPNGVGSYYGDPNGQEFILGGNNVKNNPNYFRGTMSSLLLYSEALSASGVESVLAQTCEYSPILSYAIGEGDSEYCVKDRSGNGYNASTAYYERPYELPKYEYSLVVVGDTQCQVEYDLKNGTNYTANIYDYIIKNKVSKKIGYVFGVGDITQNNTVDEWALAKEQVSKLDAAGIGYSLVPGDHDNNADYYTKHTNMNNAFLETLRPRIAGFYNEAYGLTNYYMTFDVATEKYAVLCLEVGPRTDVMRWANEVIESHPDRKFFITTHSYLAKDGTTTDPGDPGAKNQAGAMGTNTPSNGDRMWDELVSLHENVFMVFSGHIAYENVVMRQDRGVNGNTVTQFLVNHQSMNVASSMVCVLYFSTDGSVRTEWISTTKSLDSEKDMFHKTQSMMSFNTNALSEEGTLIAESRFDGETNGIKAAVNGSVAQMSTDNGMYKLYFSESVATTYASFTKRVNFDSIYAYKYLTLDFDISTETELFDSLNLFFVPRNSSGGKNNTRFYIVQKNGTYYLSNESDGSGELYPLGISHANEWAHITVVFDTENLIGGNGDTAKCSAHFFINGKYAMTNESPFQSGATYFNEIRLWTSSKTSKVTDTLCVDNLVLKGFTPDDAKGIDKVLSEKWLSLSTVKGIEYKEDYKFPKGSPLARVTSNGVETLYYNEFELGRSVKEGDTVTMLRDAYTPVSFANTVTVENEGTYKLVYGVAKDFAITQNDVTTFCTASEFLATAKALVANQGAIIEQYNDITFTSSIVFTVSSKGASVPKVWNMNGHSLKATAQSDHFFKFSNSDNLANWIINNGSIGTTSRNTVFTGNSADYMEFNDVDFLDGSTMEIRDGKIRLNGCTIRTNAGAFCTVNAARVNKGSSVYYRNCDITMTLTSPSGLILKYNGSAGNDTTVTFEYCNIKRYTENSSKALISTVGTKDATLTEFSPVVNFIGTKVYTRIFAFHDFGELTINVTEGSHLDINHMSVDNCKTWSGSTYLGNATEPNADRYKLTFNLEDGTYLSISNLVDNSAGYMKEENLTVILGEKNHYPKANNDPNLPYVIGAPDFTAKSSLTLYSDFDYNLFVPVGAGVDTVIVDTKTLSPVDVYAIGDEYYHRYTFKGIYVNEVTESMDVACISEDYDLHLSVSILSYAEKVLLDEENADAHQLMLDMLAYAKEAYVFSEMDDAEIAKIDALIDTYGVAGTYTPVVCESRIPKAISEYVDGISISLGNTPAYKFRIAKDSTVILSYVDVDGKTQSMRYEAKAGQFIQLNLHMFDFASEISIAIDGVAEVGTYNLYTYIHTVENDNYAENDSCLALAKALYTYSKSARAYKSGGAK